MSSFRKTGIISVLVALISVNVDALSLKCVRVPLRAESKNGNASDGADEDECKETVLQQVETGRTSGSVIQPQHMRKDLPEKKRSFQCKGSIPRRPWNTKLDKQQLTVFLGYGKFYWCEQNRNVVDYRFNRYSGKTVKIETVSGQEVNWCGHESKHSRIEFETRDERELALSLFQREREGALEANMMREHSSGTSGTSGRDDGEGGNHDHEVRPVQHAEVADNQAVDADVAVSQQADPVAQEIDSGTSHVDSTISSDEAQPTEQNVQTDQAQVNIDPSQQQIDANEQTQQANDPNQQQSDPTQDEGQRLGQVRNDGAHSSGTSGTSGRDHDERELLQSGGGDVPGSPEPGAGERQPNAVIDPLNIDDDAHAPEASGAPGPVSADGAGAALGSGSADDAGADWTSSGSPEQRQGLRKMAFQHIVRGKAQRRQTSSSAYQQSLLQNAIDASRHATEARRNGEAERHAQSLQHRQEQKDVVKKAHEADRKGNANFHAFCQKKEKEHNKALSQLAAKKTELRGFLEELDFVQSVVRIKRGLEREMDSTLGRTTRTQRLQPGLRTVSIEDQMLGIVSDQPSSAAAAAAATASVAGNAGRTKTEIRIGELDSEPPFDDVRRAFEAVLKDRLDREPYPSGDEFKEAAIDRYFSKLTRYYEILYSNAMESIKADEVRVENEISKAKRDIAEVEATQKHYARSMETQAEIDSIDGFLHGNRNATGPVLPALPNYITSTPTRRRGLD